MTGSQTLLPYFNKMGSLRRPRPRFMSSPALSDLPRFYASRQAVQLNSSAMWNSVQNAVINVFKGGGLQANELYSLNENIRHLLKSELGSFITDYFQNQLLSKGLAFMEEKVKLYEGENRVLILSELWDHFFTEILPTLQAIFYPVQGQELTIRQIALLGFRDLVLLKVNLDRRLPPFMKSPVPPPILQMLLILQGIHEPSGPSEGYLKLEELVKMVVSPYLVAYGDRSYNHSSAPCILEHRFPKCHLRSDTMPYTPLEGSSLPVERCLSPLTEQEGEAYLEKCGSVRRHTVANAHTDIQLLAMASIMHPRSEEAELSNECLLLQPSFSQRQFSSEPNILDNPSQLLSTGPRDSPEHSCPSPS
ncbi:proline-rich protein 5-like [Bufo bufo]|uniref:proline-rich protein 5-like n=1 Tax=Bufo bufo TaxID=8384 RepID=UPI001ABE102A|nr:proline-rich protein 5-like [Bufo bufo]